MSIKNIVKKLHVSKNSASKFIVAGVFFAILIYAFTLRKATFNLPHFRGDQHHYLSLALKLETQGIRGYNLRGVNVFDYYKKPFLLKLVPGKGKGHILQILEKSGVTYYDEPLHHVPFGFPAAIMISHKLFSSTKPYFALLIPDYEIIKKAGPKVGLRKFRFDPSIRNVQFYSIIVPLFFSLLFIASVFFLAKLLFNNAVVSLTSMFLMTICPIDILTSHKIWADDMTAAFTVLAAILYILAVQKQQPVIALTGGLCCGISAITKPNGVLVVFAIIAWHFVVNFRKLFKKETLWKTIFDKNLLMFGLGSIIAGGYWYAKLIKTYGSPIYSPVTEGISKADKSGWFKMVNSRPKHLYLFGIPYQNPIFGLAYLSPLWIWIKKNKDEIKNLLFPILWIIITFGFAYKFLGGEHRYMLPTYPAFAICGAYVADKLRIILDEKTGIKIGTILFIIALLVSALWSVPMGLDTVFLNGALIFKPF